MRRWIIAAIAATALAATGVWLGVAHAGGKAGTKPEKGVVWASFNNNGGLLAHSKDAMSGSHSGTGIYDVFFSGTLSNCGLVATSNLGTLMTGVAMSGNNGAEVHFRDDTGALTDTYGTIVAVCTK
jgi:hypothetical protein